MYLFQLQVHITPLVFAHVRTDKYFEAFFNMERSCYILSIVVEMPLVVCCIRLL